MRVLWLLLACLVSIGRGQMPVASFPYQIHTDTYIRGGDAYEMYLSYSGKGEGRERGKEGDERKRNSRGERETVE